MGQGRVWGSVSVFSEPGASRGHSYLFGNFLFESVKYRYILWAREQGKRPVPLRCPSAPESAGHLVKMQETLG